MLHDLGHMVGALIDVEIGNDQQHALRRTLDQTARRFEHRHAGAFRAHQSARHIESILGKKEIQVVPRNPARDVGITLAHEISVAVSERFQSGINLAAASAFTNDCVKLLSTGCADLHPQAVVGENLKRFDIVIGLTRHDGMHAARVVTNHAAEGAAIVGGGVRCESQVMFLSGSAQVVENHARLDSGDAAYGIDLQNPVHILGKIENDRHVTALSGQRSTSTAAENGRTELAGQGDGCDDVVCVTRDDNPDWNLAVARSVSRVERTAALVKAHLTAKMAA